jgi:NADH dehydrogenase [ubiquinone] 1 alpha subcomplex assembly factor 1
MKISLAAGALSLLFTASLLAQNMKTNSTPETTVCDFAQPTNFTWQIVNDDVMGGVSTSTFQVTNQTAIFRGAVSLENNGGFASVRTTPANLNLAEATEFILRVRGDGRQYKFTARMNSNFDGAPYQSSFATRKAEWQEIRLPFDKFAPTFRGRQLTGEPPLSAPKLSSIGFLIADQQAGPFQLEIAWIKTISRR